MNTTKPSLRKEAESHCSRTFSSAQGSQVHTVLTPNPSIEGMPKRLRLLCTPHVKR